MKFKKIIAGVAAAAMMITSDVSSLNVICEYVDDNNTYFGHVISGEINNEISYYNKNYYCDYPDVNDAFQDYAYGFCTCVMQMADYILCYRRYKNHVEITGVEYGGNYNNDSGSRVYSPFELYIPSVIDNLPVTDVNFDFSGEFYMVDFCSSDQALRYVSSVRVDEDNKYLCTDNGVLYNYNKTELLLFPAASSVGVTEETDYGYRKRSFTVPESVRKIGSAAFAYTDFDTIDVADGSENTDVDYDRYYSFRRELSQHSYNWNILYLNDNIEETGTYAFACSKVRKVLVPYSTKQIGFRAFFACEYIEALAFPNPNCKVFDSADTICRHAPYNDDISNSDNFSVRVIVPMYGKLIRQLEKYGYCICPVEANIQQTKISADNFPDSSFREYIRYEFDHDNDGYLSDSDINDITALNLSVEENSESDYADGYISYPQNLLRNIKSLEGVERFLNLSELHIRNGNIESLDLFALTKLRVLDCSGGKLKNLKLNHLAELGWLDCSDNEISEIEINDCQRLTYLDCSHNQLSELDVFDSYENNGYYLYEDGGYYPDYSSNKQLDYIDCSYNKIKRLDFSNKVTVYELYCNNNELQGITLNHLPRIFDCSENRITELNGLKGSSEILDCHNNNLSYIDLSGIDYIRYFIGSGNRFFTDITRDSEGREKISVIQCKSDIYLDYFPVCGINPYFIVEQTGEYPYFPCGNFGSINAVSGIKEINESSIVPEDNADTVVYSLDCYYSGMSGERISSSFNSNKYFEKPYRSDFEVTLHSYGINHHPDNNNDNICDFCSEEFSEKQASGLRIDSGIFKDEEFRRFISDCFDPENTGYINEDILRTTTELNPDCCYPSDYNITSFEGLEKFTALETLTYTPRVSVECLDFSNNKTLKNLRIGGYRHTVSENTVAVKSLDVSGCESLEVLECGYNNLEKLDITGCINLKTLSCEYNKLTELDIESNCLLSELYCTGNQLRYLNAEDRSFNQFYGECEIYAESISVCGMTPSELTGTDTGYENIRIQRGYIHDGKIYPEKQWNYEYDENGNYIKIPEYIIEYSWYLNNNSGWNQDFALRVKLISSTEGHTDINSDGKCDACDVLVNIAVNETNFPDWSFRNYISEFDKDGDGFLNQSELNKITSISFSNSGSYESFDSSVIRYFTKLERLDLSGVKMNNNTLDLSGLYYLQELRCDGCGLENLKLESPPLYSLNCSGNNLKELDLSGCYGLSELRCSYNNIESMDFLYNPYLRKLECTNNPLKSVRFERYNCLYDAHIRSEVNLDSACRCGFRLEDLGYGISASDIECFDDVYHIDGAKIENGYIIPDGSESWDSNYESTIRFIAIVKKNEDNNEYSDDIRAEFNITIGTLYDHENKNDDEFCDVCGQRLRVSIDENNFPDENFREFVRCQCDKNSDGILDTEELNITEIYAPCYGINTAEGIGYFESLEHLDLSSNQLSQLDLSRNTKLKSVNLNTNTITSLNLENCTELERIDLGWNELSSIDGFDFSGCTSLREIYLGNNHFSVFNADEFEAKGICINLEYNIKEIEKFPACAFTFADIGVENADMSRVTDVVGAIVSGDVFIPYPETGTITYKYRISGDENVCFDYADFEIRAEVLSRSHTPEKVLFKKAECTRQGIREHWYCPSCNKYYADSECTVLAKQEDFIIPPKGHTASDVMDISEETLISESTEDMPAVYCFRCKDCGELMRENTFQCYTYQNVLFKKSVAETICSEAEYHSEQSLSVLEAALADVADLTDNMNQKAYEYRFNILSNAIAQIKPANAVVSLECQPAGTGVLSGAGRYSSGETVHLTSKNISGYTFAGWYIEDEKISEQAVYDYFISEPGNITFTAHYTENTKSELTINPGRGKVVYSFNSTEKTIYNKLIKSFPTGTEFTATAVPYEGFTFQFWIDSRSNRIVSESLEFKFTLSQISHYEACYISENSDSDTHYVIFRDLNGAVLKAEDIDHGADAEEPYHLNYEGYIFTGWDKSTKNITSDMVITAVYVPDSGYTVGVEEGTGFINDPKDTYSFGEVVSVSAYPEKDGMEFTGWYSGDNLVSTDLNYSFYVVADTWLTAKYEGKSDISIILNYEMGDREIADTSQKVSMLMKWNFPDDYSIVSTGLVRTYDDQKAENLTLETVDGTTVKQVEFGLTDSIGTYVYTVTMGPNSKVKTLWTRGYVIYKDKDSGEIFTMYTDVLSSAPVEG